MKKVLFISFVIFIINFWSNAVLARTLSKDIIVIYEEMNSCMKEQNLFTSYDRFRKKCAGYIYLTHRFSSKEKIIEIYESMNSCMKEYDLFTFYDDFRERCASYIISEEESW
ncbi:hypothetical protein [Phocoenobacter skyensis]|uniref:Uncharacterized protein n=1 Tax=Phocoenobacter skyensis TaxID=97481 RepID=A0A1H7Z234_9PAST|nr:hypothetical protein [Pasteurella skyensis]MDP8080174.1 hypothetical protein [Pasteurella skyensis]MDP8086134.1 hypothetical protein [Pasteurella skyensis]MDP8185892.1 hypothetical protein [Pasteurella skyensis]QLB22955.1 hypothetical protein A6B44_06950 [Pasteurella skyensis]SEM52376.1 hypothetical protein SAMN05444853_1225 [Pasteurella skyensis]